MRLDSLPAREAFRRLRRLACRIKRHLHGGTALLLSDVLLLFCEFFDDEREAARRAERPHRAVREAQFLQSLLRVLAKLFEHPGHRMCRNFLRTDLQQQILAHSFAPLFSIG